MRIQSLPEAQQLWDDPSALIETWAYQPEKEDQERKVCDFIGPVAGTVADLGCGSGRLSRVLQCKAYWGFDSSVGMIHQCQQLATDYRKFSVVDIFNFEPGIDFDAVIMLDVAIHQNEPVQAVLRILDLWRAKRFVFSLLIGNERQRLLNTVVVSADEAHTLLANTKRTFVAPVKNENFLWYLVEVNK